jgi:phosphatidate cytidylyltransferase
MTSNDILSLYLSLIGGLLIAAALILLTLEKIFHKDVSSVWRIYRGWLVMIPFFLVFLLLGRVIFILGVLILSIFSYIEFSRATQPYRNQWIANIVYLGIISVAILALIRNPPTGFFGAYGMFMALPVYVIGLIVLMPILQNHPEGQLREISLGVMGFLYFGWMFGHISFLADSFYSANYVLYLVFATQIADISAYNFGKLFGRHKLRENVSPNKTLEGAIGALVVSLCLPWLFRSTFPEFGPLQLILTGLIMGIGSQLGDLTISLIKRDLKIKDMGTLIPGHGGILDRIDSLIIATPLFFHMIRYFGALYP